MTKASCRAWRVIVEYSDAGDWLPAVDESQPASDDPTARIPEDELLSTPVEDAILARYLRERGIWLADASYRVSVGYR